MILLPILLKPKKKEKRKMSTISQPAFFEQNLNSQLDYDEEFKENPMEFIDNRLSEKGVEENTKWRSKYYNTEEKVEEFKQSPLPAQLFSTNRVLRMYLGNMEQDTRHIRCAVIDGIPYKEWQDLMVDHVVPVLGEYITLGHFTTGAKVIPVDEEGDPIDTKDDGLIINPNPEPIPNPVETN